MKVWPHKKSSFVAYVVGRGSRRANCLSVGRRSLEAELPHAASILVGRGSCRAASQRGVALVITLLMLSVITFLAVAFLAMTRRDTSAKTATLDVSTAQSMSETALARAEAEIMARMMAQTDILAFDYMASQDFINPAGYAPGLASNNYNNVNYDFQFVSINNGVLVTKTWGTIPNPSDWAQNIANLWYDPRPPVFINTNTDPRYVSNDFRYYVDLNRNGMFEGTTFRSTDFADHSAFPVAGNTTGQPGEPEWVGVLADPSHPHSPSNYFIGRYAFMVQPLGKELDINYIHNESQSNYNHSFSPYDLFARDQGVGSWELNLAAYLRDLNTNSYDNPLYVVPGERYQYNLPNLAGGDASFSYGYCFDDALFITSNRLRGAMTIPQDFANYLLFQTNGIDDFGSSPETNAAALAGYNGPGNFLVPGSAPFEWDSYNDPDDPKLYPRTAGAGWPGSYETNFIYDMQDVFDARKTGGLAGRLARAGGSNGWPASVTQNEINYDRYTYQRMLASMGAGTQSIGAGPPNNAVFVYPDGITTNALGTNSLVRPRMDINYDNSAQLALGANGIYVPMPTNPAPWTDPVKFFTNCANLLLRTQDFPITNYYLSILYNTNIMEYHHFDLGSMLPYYPIYGPVYTNANGSVIYSSHYTAQLHRMLQLAANIYDATLSTNWLPNGTNAMRLPSVFRPICMASNNFLYIIGYTNVTMADFTPNDPTADTPNNPFGNSSLWYYMSNVVYPGDRPAIPRGVPLTRAHTGYDYNFYGLPWVVGAVKGLPSFNKISQVTALGITRKLEFVRPNPGTPTVFQTNQFYEFSISNHFGVDAWNSYHEPLQRPLLLRATNYQAVTLTNNSISRPWGYTWYFTNATVTPLNGWPAWQGGQSKTGFMLADLTNNDFFPLQQYLDSAERFFPPGPYWDTNTFTIHGWTLGVTNTLMYVLQDYQTGAILDFVNPGPIGTYMNITNLLNRPQTLPPVAGRNALPLSYQLVWNTFGGADAYTGFPQYFSAGASNQVLIGEGLLSVQDWTPQNAIAAGYTGANAGADFVAAQQTFYSYLRGGTTNTTMGDPFQPTTVLAQATKWEANDPLVHYTVEDLTGASAISNYVVIFNPSWNPQAVPDYLGQVNPNYSPWGSGQNGAGNPAMEDYITQSDDWQFPTNKFPGVGWLGRVHRGTPWQTVFLKADPVPGNAYANPTSNPYRWVSQWVGDLSPGLPWPGASYPTNDWRLLDLFTAAPNDNAMRGTLSVNQTNSAAWHALLDGLVVLTNDPKHGVYGLVINPEVPYGTNANAVDYIVGQINTLRATQTNGVFHSIGDILQVPALTVSSPYIDVSDSSDPPRDEVVERIPQQIGSLLRLGEPQFVIYAWGQSLRPKSFYNPGPSLLGSPNLFKLCTNYSITGEFLTRTVCHLDLTQSDPFGQHPKLKVDSFNIIPAAQ